MLLDHLCSRPFVLHTNHRDPLVLSQEEKGKGDLCLGFGPKWSVYLPFGPKHQQDEPKPKQRGEKRRRGKRREERRQSRRTLMRERMAQQGHGRSLMWERRSRWRGRRPPRHGRPPHIGEEEQVARMQASTAWKAPSCRRGGAGGEGQQADLLGEEGGGRPPHEGEETGPGGAG